MLWKLSSLVIFGATPAFYTYEIYCGDGAPSLQWMGDNWNWFDIPRQFQDGGGWDLESYRYPDDHDFMNFQYTGKRTIGRPTHTMFWAGLLTFVSRLDFDYVSKMRYNKEKDLVFITKPNKFFGE